jgi:competence protein ComEA
MKNLLSAVTLSISLLLPTLAIAKDAAAYKPAATEKAVAKPVTAPKPLPPVTAPTEKVKLVDINSASEADLVALPGVGDAYAKKIVEGRPYAKKDQLKSRKILPAGVYAKVQKLIVAEQPAASTAIAPAKEKMTDKAVKPGTDPAGKDLKSTVASPKPTK